MSELGKIDRGFFDEYVYPHLGASRDDVVLEPAHGVDFGAMSVGDRVVAMATDPVFVMPSLGFERAAWFAFHILFSDVAVSGLEPSHLSVDFNLPPEITDEEFATIWRTFDREAEALGVSILTGHTARYAGCNYPMVGGATAIAIGDPADLVRPDGARPGDRVVITKGPAVEATGLLAIQFEELLADDLGAGDLAAATERFADMSPVRDALVVADAAGGGVNAMHDATEGGVYGGLHELAHSGGVRIDVEREAVPVLGGVEPVCDWFDIDPWISISEGTLLASVDPASVDDVLDGLENEGIPAADVGAVSDGSGGDESGVYFDGDPVDRPERDPFWAAFEAGLAASTEGEAS